MLFSHQSKDTLTIASVGRMVTEECYRQLRGRWQILLGKCEGSKEVRVATLACMVLYKYALIEGTRQKS